MNVSAVNSFAAIIVSNESSFSGQILVKVEVLRQY